MHQKLPKHLRKCIACWRAGASQPSVRTGRFFYIYICTGVALRNLIGRFKHAQRANVRPAKTSSGQRVCRST